MRLNFRRLMPPSAMKFELDTRLLPDPSSAPDGDSEGFLDADSPGNLRRIREGVLQELCDLLKTTGEISNESRLFRDLYNREKRAVTAIGEGVAIPHVRTLQARSFIMAFARSREGLPFFAIDEEPVHLFFAMVAPPYEDRMYLKVYKALGSALLQAEHMRSFMQAREPNDVWAVLEQFA